MGFLIGATALGWVAAVAIVAVLAAVALPIAWLWMLIDALLREERDYPGGSATGNQRLLWVLLIAFVHVSAVAYFFIVYRHVPRAAATRNVAVAA